MQPSDSARSAAESLLQADSVREKVLRESAETGEESGRTLCGGRDLGPGERDFRSVQLPHCRTDETAVMHGGGGHDLRAPKHSLVDMAVVLWSRPQASLVVGSDQSDLFMAPDQSSLENAKRVYRDAIGYDVDGPADVSELIRTGSIDARIAGSARQEIRTRLANLFMRVDTPHEIPPVVDVPKSDAVAQAPQRRPVEAGDSGGIFDDVAASAIRTLKRVWASIKNVFSIDPTDVDVNLISLLASEIASALVLFGLLRFFGGTPTEIAKSSAS